MINLNEIKSDVYANSFYELSLERDEEGFITKANVVAMSETLPELTCRFYDAKWYCDIKYKACDIVDAYYIKTCKTGHDTSLAIQTLLNSLEEDSAIDFQTGLLGCYYY